ncbi:MAG: ABC transporter substrate-binding protein [Thermodesulfovibrionales bacterium]|nr:ABC transporter substrate-binding protein [Thermodesulfovibrionales bacterium]
MKFVLQWLPQGQFAGYFVGFEKGYYRKHGIDLEIINGGPDISPAQYLKEGKADISTMWLSTAIQKRAEGLNIVNIAQMFQRSSLLIVTMKKSGIKTPKDLHDKKVSIFDGDFAIQPKALFRLLNITPQLIPQSATVNLFLRGAVDATSAMRYNEYHTILSSGINEDELTVFSFNDYNLGFPEDGIYVTEGFIKQHRDLACAFVKASIEGWSRAFANPDEAVDIVLKYMKKAGVPANRSHQRWMIMKIKDVIIGNNDTNIGLLSKDSYQMVINELFKAQLIKRMTTYEDFYRPCK